MRTCASNRRLWADAFPSGFTSVPGDFGNFILSGRYSRESTVPTLCDGSAGSLVFAYTLRGGFTTHPRLAGTDIRDIQDLLGHTRVAIPMVGTHGVWDLKASPRSPLDALEETAGEGGGAARRGWGFGSCSRTPTGFHPPAQGCGLAATLGLSPTNDQPQRGCVRSAQGAGWVGRNPFRVGMLSDPGIQGSSFLATLGWGYEAPLGHPDAQGGNSGLRGAVAFTRPPVTDDVARAERTNRQRPV